MIKNQFDEVEERIISFTDDGDFGIVYACNNGDFEFIF